MRRHRSFSSLGDKGERPSPSSTISAILIASYDCYGYIYVAVDIIDTDIFVHVSSGKNSRIDLGQEIFRMCLNFFGCNSFAGKG